MFSSSWKNSRICINLALLEFLVDLMMVGTRNKFRGFTLIEIAVVLVVIGLLLGMILKPLGASFEQSKRRQASLQLEEIRDAIIGFASVNGRLPCPAIQSSAGQEQATCVKAHGFVPSAVLGISGNFNKKGILLDPWNNPLRYSVSLADSTVFGNVGVPDFVSMGEMQQVGFKNLKSDIVICASNSANLCPKISIRANEVPAVLYSLGKDISAAGDQAENLDNDNVFVNREYSQKQGNEFDDIVIWLSENILFTRLIDAGVLP